MTTLADIKEAYVQFCTWKRSPTCGRAQAEAEFDGVFKHHLASLRQARVHVVAVRNSPGLGDTHHESWLREAQEFIENAQDELECA